MSETGIVSRALAALPPALLAVVLIILGLLVYLDRELLARERVLTALVTSCMQEEHTHHP